ncbi:hypothetical protein FBR05_12365 [Deltaproteobacteria bacterium PRO3]|nr:hypothetical protein [Deltaproteobacteria bacterium PRO3]
MGNAFVNAFAVLEPASGSDAFSTRQAPRRPASFFEARAGVNRLFRAPAAAAPFAEDLVETAPSEAVGFVVEQFLQRPKWA